MPEKTEKSQENQKPKESAKATPQDAKQALENLKTEASKGAEELKKTGAKLKSGDAKAYLENGQSELNRYVLSIAEKGRELDRNSDKLPNMEQLANELHAQLNSQKDEINNFAAIEPAETAQTGCEKENEKLNAEAAKNDPDALIKSKNGILSRLPKTDGLPSSPATAKLRADIESRSKALKEKITADISGIGEFKKDRDRIKTLGEEIKAFSKMVAEYEKNPAPEKLKAINETGQKLDVKKISDEIFSKKIGVGEANLTSSLYQNLWQNEFRTAENALKELNGRIETKEKDILTGQAKTALSLARQTWDTKLKPKIDFYDATKGEERAQSEKDLLSKLLETKGMLSGFGGNENGNKIEADVSREIATMLEQVNAQIRKMENNREAERNDVDFSKKGLSKYVKIDAKEGNYSFTPEFDSLPEKEKIAIRYQVEEVANRNKTAVRNETTKAAMEFANPEEKMKKLGEILGEKGKSYFEGIQKLQRKPPDMDGAVKDFQTYVNQPFNKEESDNHKETVSDAKNKIQEVYTEKLNQIDNLFGDVKELMYAARKMGGNPELSPQEGIESDAVKNELMAFRKEVSEGKVSDFDQRFGQLKEKVRETIAKAKSKEADILNKLDRLYSLSQEKDPEKRKKGFADFAKEARDVQAYGLAKKYLDYALEQDYKEAAKHLDKAEVLKGMLSEPKFMEDLKKQAGATYEQMLRENPSLKGSLTMETVQQKLLDRALNERYTKELRRSMTGEVGTDSVVAQYNNWFPLDDPKWYKPWDYGAEQWDEFQVDCIKFAWETIPTIGIGMAAGAAGKVGAKLGGQVVKSLIRSGVSEAEIAIIEQGGMQALKQSVTSGRALTFGAARLVGAVTFEGATMYGMGLGMEYMKTGEVHDFSTPGEIPAHLAENMIKVSVFKAIGVANQSIKPLQTAIHRGGVAGKAAWLGSETLSGAGGTVLDYAIAQAKGHDMTGQEAFQAMMSNYLVSMGMGIVHGRGAGTEKANQRMKEVKSDAPVKPVGGDKPGGGETPNSDGKPVNGEAPAPKPAEPQMEATKKYVPEKADAEATPSAEPKPREPVPQENTKVYVEKPAEAVTKPINEERTRIERKPPQKPPEPDSGERTKVEGKSPRKPAEPQPAEEVTKATPRRKVVRAEPEVRPQEPATRAKENTGEHLGGEDITSPQTPKARIERPLVKESDPKKLHEILKERMASSPEVAAKINDALKNAKVSGEILQDLSVNELSVLINDIDNIEVPVLEKIIKRDYMVIDEVRNGERIRVRCYKNDKAKLGEGGLGEVYESYYGVWEVNGREKPIYRMEKGAVKIEKSFNETSDIVKRNEIATLKEVRDLPDKYGILTPVYVSEGHMVIEGNLFSKKGESISITRKLDPLPGQKSTQLTEVLESIPPEQAFEFMEQAISGLEKLHGMNRIHLDIKAGNIFVGMLDGKAVAVLGDLATMPISEIPNMTLKAKIVRIDNGRGGSRLAEITVINHKELPKDHGLPSTHPYMENPRAFRALNAQFEWVKAHPGEPVPARIKSLPDCAQWAKMLERVRDRYCESGVLPDKVSVKVREKVDKLIARLDDIPDLENLPPGQTREQAYEKLNDSYITLEELRVGHAEISQIIKENKKIN